MVPDIYVNLCSHWGQADRPRRGGGGGGGGEGEGAEKEGDTTPSPPSLTISPQS